MRIDKRYNVTTFFNVMMKTIVNMQFEEEKN